VPWKETRAVDSRMELVVRIRAGERVSDLCREYGIFVERFAARGLEGLLDQSRARHTQNHRTSAEVVERIVKLKKEHPSWGSKKLKEFLEREDKGVRFPSRSTIDVILCRSGLVKPRRMRREVPPTLGPLTIPEGPNHVWAVDYKGQFRLGNGRLCYPLTCSDLSSRFVLGCEALDSTELEPAREAFEHLFARFGLPEVIRTDNGSPFASARSLFGLSRRGLRLCQRVDDHAFICVDA
jgi:putative transposase